MTMQKVSYETRIWDVAGWTNEKQVKETTNAQCKAIEKRTDVPLRRSHEEMAQQLWYEFHDKNEGLVANPTHYDTNQT